MAKHAIVIGAGVAGLATAGLLAREGYHVRVFEKLDAPGGRAGQLTDSGFRWDTGPSWYLMPEAYDRFFELMGTTTEQAYELVDLHPAYRLFPEGSPSLDVDSGVGNVATLFDALDPGAGKKVQRYLRNATDVYHLSLRHFLYTTFSNPRDFLRADILRRLPYLARLLSSSLDTWVRNRFPHPILRQILSYPAVFLSTQPTQAPALYSLMSHTDLVEGVRYPRGGFAAIMSAIEKIDREAGVEFYYEHEVTDITIESSRACGITAAGPPRNLHLQCRCCRLRRRPPPHRNSAAATPPAQLPRKLLEQTQPRPWNRTHHARSARAPTRTSPPQSALQQRLGPRFRRRLFRATPLPPTRRITIHLHL